MGASRRKLPGVLLVWTALSLCALPARAWELALCADPDAAPYSSESDGGFDLAIADTVADALGAELSVRWMPDHRSATLLRHLHAGDCDMVMGMIDGRNGILGSHAYYRTGYVFVRRAGEPPIRSLDDPALGTLRVGVPGGARRPTPPALGLSRRGLLGNLVHFGATAATETAAEMGAALADGAIDVAILWGPMAATLNADAERFAVMPLAPEIDLPFIPMVAAFTIGVRPHDEALRDAIDAALAARWDEVQGALERADVPTLPLPRPIVTAESAG